jgi:hypothetical protein
VPAGLLPEERQVGEVGRGRPEELDHARQLAGAEPLEEPDDLAAAGAVQGAADDAEDRGDREAPPGGLSERLGKLGVDRGLVLAVAEPDADGGSFPRVVHGTPPSGPVAAPAGQRQAACRPVRSPVRAPVERALRQPVYQEAAEEVGPMPGETVTVDCLNFGACGGQLEFRLVDEEVVTPGARP